MQATCYSSHIQKNLSTIVALRQGFSTWGMRTPGGTQRVCQGIHALHASLGQGPGCLTCTVRVPDRESCARCGWECTSHHPTVVDWRLTGVAAFWLVGLFVATFFDDILISECCVDFNNIIIANCISLASIRLLSNPDLFLMEIVDEIENITQHFV